MSVKIQNIKFREYFFHNSVIVSYLKTDRWNNASRQSVVFQMHIKWVVSSPKCHVIQVFGEMELKLYKFLTSTRDRSQLSASLFKYYFTGNIAPNTHWREEFWVDSKASLDIWQRIIPAPVRNASPVDQPVASHFIYWAIPAPHFLYLSLFNDDISSVEMLCSMNWRRMLLRLAEKDIQGSGHNLLWSNVLASDAKSKNHQEKLQTDFKHVYNEIGNAYIIKHIIFQDVMPRNLVEIKLVSFYQTTRCHIPHLLRITVVRTWNLTFILFIFYVNE
jgi:hypothetical protein